MDGIKRVTNQDLENTAAQWYAGLDDEGKGVISIGIESRTLEGPHPCRQCNEQNQKWYSLLEEDWILDILQIY